LRLNQKHLRDNFDASTRIGVHAAKRFLLFGRHCE
jgi:hypothetical protein